MKENVAKYSVENRTSSYLKLSKKYSMRVRNSLKDRF